MKQNKVFRNILRITGMFAAVITLAFGLLSCSSSDGDGGGSNNGNNINAPKAAEIGWPSDSQPVIDGLNGLFEAYDPTTTEEQREAVQNFSDAFNSAGMDPKSFMPVVALATVAEDPAAYGDDYFAAVKTNLSAYSGTFELDPETNQWIYTPGGDGKTLDIKFRNPEGKECKVTIDRSGSTGVLHTKNFDITQDVIDFFVARGFDIDRLGLSAEQLDEIKNGKAIRLSLEMPTHATQTFTVDGKEVLSTTMDIAAMVMNESASAGKQRRAINYYAMFDQLDVTGNIGFGPYSLVLARCHLADRKFDFDLRLNQGSNLLLGLGMEQKWNALHFTSFADMVPATLVTSVNMLNVTCLRIEMVESKRDDIVALAKMLEKALSGSTKISLFSDDDDDDDEMKITDDMLLLMLNTYFDTAFYTPDMKTRVGQVFFKMETVTDEDGDEDDEMMPYIRTSDGKEHLLAEAFAGKLDEEEVKAKLSTLLMTLLSNKMLTQLMRDPFFGVSIDAVNFIPGMPVDWTVGDRYDEDK